MYVHIYIYIYIIVYLHKPMYMYIYIYILGGSLLGGDTDDGGPPGQQLNHVTLNVLQ